MENKKRNRRKQNGGFVDRLFANIGNPEDIEEAEWFLDSPDVRLTRVFSVVLILHIVALSGILSFKMLNKAASEPLASNSVISSPATTAIAEVELAGRAGSLDGSEEPGHYVVVPGDTLSEIASKLGVSTSELSRVNRLVSADDIVAGMLLKVPIGEAVAGSRYQDLPSHPTMVTTDRVAQVTSDAGSFEARSSGVVYQVQKGDTAWGIAKRFGVTHQDLIGHNQIKRPDALQIGQMLEIPNR